MTYTINVYSRAQNKKQIKLITELVRLNISYHELFGGGRGGIVITVDKVIRERDWTHTDTSEQIV